MIHNKTYNSKYKLDIIIASDLFKHEKLPIIFLIFIIISSIFLIMTTHNTRRLTSKRETILIETHALDVEWRNLILEKHVLGDRSRIERIAIEDFKMKHIDPLKETIIVFKTICKDQ